jgi:hypothetical protein
MKNSERFAASAARPGDPRSHRPRRPRFGIHRTNRLGRRPSHPFLALRPVRDRDLARAARRALRRTARPQFAQAARDGRAVDYVEALRIGATIVDDPAAETSITRDPKDDYLVRPPWASGASMLVSGDRDLLELNRTDVRVLSPRALVDQLHGA